MNNIHQFYTKGEKEIVILSFKGEVTSGLLASILKLLECKIEESEEPIIIKRKITNIVVECLQNLFHHTEKFDNSSKISVNTVLFIVLKKVNEYTIITGNYILTKNVIILKNKLDLINSLDKLELKNIYRKTLTNGQISNKGGGGLGIIDIARRSGKELSYKFDKIDEKYSFYTLRVSVALNN